MSDTITKNVHWQESSVTAEARENLLKQTGRVVWFSGLSGSGKSTIAFALEKELLEQGHLAYCLDGDNIRHGLNKGLGFSDCDRSENIRRVAEVAKLMQDAGLIVLVSCITPQQSMRNMATTIIGQEHLTQVYVKAALETCQQRDPKGLYHKVVTGEVKQFTGVHQGFEEPTSIDITIDTETMAVDDAVGQVLRHIV